LNKIIHYSCFQTKADRPTQYKNKNIHPHTEKHKKPFRHTKYKPMHLLWDTQCVMAEMYNYLKEKNQIISKITFGMT
jgi:hypothetical protein